jgi:hypothetical protein
MRSRNRTTTLAKDEQVIDGIRKRLQGATLLHVAGKPYSPAALEARIQERVAATNRIATARAQWVDATAAYDAIDPEVHLVVRDLKNVVIGMFGEDAPAMADFGFAPRRKGTLTAEQKAQAIERRTATRKARRTVGPKAKLAIKGVVDPDAIPPTLPSPEHAPSPSPINPNPTKGDPS